MFIVTYELGVAELIEQGYLAPLTGKKPRAATIDTAGLRVERGDYRESDLAGRVDDDDLTLGSSTRSSAATPTGGLGDVTAHVALAASIASAIAVSCDRILIGEDGYFMLHAPFVSMTDNADELERMGGLCASTGRHWSSATAAGRARARRWFRSG